MADLYGKQTFKNGNIENTVFYKFNSQEDLDKWLKTDMSIYQSVVKKDYTRQISTKKSFDSHKKNNGQTKEFSSFDVKTIDENSRFVHIKHPDPKYENDFGLVLEFKNDQSKMDFISKHGDFYKDNIRELDSNDARVLSAKAHDLTFTADSLKNPVMTVNSALKNYPQLNPSKKHLVFLSQSEPKFSRPEVYSFDSKPLRDKFVSTLKAKSDKGELPILVSKMNNFHPIAIDKATKGQILEGNMTDHFRHMKEYLAFNNSKEFKGRPNLERLNTQSFKDLVDQANTVAKSGETLEISGKDLRAVDFKNIDLKNVHLRNCTFNGKDLSGINLSGIKGTNLDFSDTNLSNTRFDSSHLDKPNFKGSHSRDGFVSFAGSNVINGDFKYANHPGADMSDSKISRSNFYDTKIPGGNFAGSSMKGVEFHKTNLKGATFDYDLSKLEGSSFKGANLDGTTIKGSNLDPGLQKTSGKGM